MKQKNSNIEDLFRSSFNNYKVEPAEGVWKKINTKLSIKQFLSPDFKHFNAFYLSAVVGLIAIIGLLLSDISETNTQVSNDLSQRTDIEVISRQINTDGSINDPQNIAENKKLTISENKRSDNQRKTKIVTSRVSEVIPFTQNQQLKSLTELAEDSPSRLEQIKAQPPKPLFKLVNKEGCVPFEIKLQNYTELAQTFEWSFGDGTKSNEVNPSHTYLYPGVYTIKLIASGVGGVAISVFDSIVVHDNITNKILKTFEGELTENEQFSINVKTDQKAEYEWDFGDGYYSDKNSVTHVYLKQGKYTITLKTWTTNNCYDSVKVTDVVVVESSNKISFPNAFIPNPGGPSSGKYYGRDVYNDIFHPVIKGSITGYSLKIYSRSGALIFESNDLNIGWDGYYQNRLMPEGVYPFISSGKFDGGHDFVKKGNITIIHRK